ncbi:Hypothetical protein A7982_07140 [Minicystis rosea]|nr:Hypothetical protein A7982_07140 [Minicystis rosea]
MQASDVERCIASAGSLGSTTKGVGSRFMASATGQRTLRVIQPGSMDPDLR